MPRHEPDSKLIKMRSRTVRNPLVLGCLAAVLASCVVAPPEPGIGEPVKFSALDGWIQDRHAEAWTGLLRSCSRLEYEPEWQGVCTAARGLTRPTDAQARSFFENWFTPHPVFGRDRGQEGLITGYYEPLLFGSRSRSGRFRHPLYGKPPDLLTIELSEVYPELKGKRLRGKLQGSRIVPYYSRSQLDLRPDLLAGNELLWVDDLVALFFLHIQGSGRVVLDDGTILGVGYADQNGHPYRSIGRELIEMGEMSREDVTMFSIRAWLRENPDLAESLLHRNPSFVFFRLRDAPGEGPIGSLNVPLVPERSIAVDRSVIPLGAPVWIETRLPDEQQTRYHRLTHAQDTGGAIRGQVRVDLFCGQGERAELMAGRMKQPLRLFVLLPKYPTPK
jgi:membrane-bound lytic murein transglycosylase A